MIAPCAKSGFCNSPIAHSGASHPDNRAQAEFWRATILRRVTPTAPTSVFIPSNAWGLKQDHPGPLAFRSPGPGQPGCAPHDSHAEENPAAGAVRDYRADPGRGRCLDRQGALETGTVPLSEPRVGVASSFDTAVRSDRRVLGLVNRSGPRGLRDAFASPHESDADLSADKESPSRSTPARPYQTRKHRQISRHRGR